MLRGLASVGYVADDVPAAAMPPTSPDRPGVGVDWHVDDIDAALERLAAMGATEHEPKTVHEAGFVTASVVDPFGNVLGVTYNPHYLDVLARDRADRPTAGG